MKNLTVESLELKIKELGGRLLELTLNNKTGDDKNYFEKVTTTDYECKLYCEKSITRKDNLETTVTNVFNGNTKELHSSIVKYVNYKYDEIYEGTIKSISLLENNRPFFDTTEEITIIYENDNYVVTKTTNQTTSGFIMDTIIQVYYKDNQERIFSIFMDDTDDVEVSYDGRNESSSILINLANNVMSLMLEEKDSAKIKRYHLNNLSFDNYTDIDKLRDIENIDDSYIQFLIGLKDGVNKFIKDNQEICSITSSNRFFIRFKLGEDVVEVEDDMVTVIKKVSNTGKLIRYYSFDDGDEREFHKYINEYLD